MDAFAVSVCKGLSVEGAGGKQMLPPESGLAGFQAPMPAVGYLLGSAFTGYISAVDHWIAFVLLCFIGINMIKESFSKEEEEVGSSFRF